MTSLSSSLKLIKNRLLAPSNNAIIHNKYILYFILFISLADLLILTVEKDVFSVSIFILVGLLTAYFSKNMLIILFIALTFTNIVKYGTKLRSEGFEPAEENDVKENKDKDAEEIYVSKDEDDDEKEEEADKKPEKKAEKKPKKKQEKEVKSDKYKENELSKLDETLTMEDASAIFSKLTKLVNTLK